MHAKRLVALALILAVCCFAYMTMGAKGNWSFVLPFRGGKLIALILVGVSVSTATVLFQTITQNRILTPSIMGFDALYVMLLTGAVFFLGGHGYVQLPLIGLFLVNVGLLVGASLILFGSLLFQTTHDLMRLILTGIIFGTLFRSLTSFMQRMIDPNEYIVIQVASYARFTWVDTDLLLIASVLTVLALAACWRMRFRLDVLALGHDAAINLGENPKRGQVQALILVAILVSVSTALVGPVAFLGLLVVSIAHLVTPGPYHSVLLPSSALIAAITLVGGQTILERVLRLSTPLSVVIDALGGLLFLALLLKGLRK